MPKIRRKFTDVRVHTQRHQAEVHDIKSSYWRVWYPDGDWEDLNNREVKKEGAWLREIASEVRTLAHREGREVLGKRLSADKPSGRPQAYPAVPIWDLMWKRARPRFPSP